MLVSTIDVNWLRTTFRCLILICKYCLVMLWAAPGAVFICGNELINWLARNRVSDSVGGVKFFLKRTAACTP